MIKTKLSEKHHLIVILGHTAGGKTTFAAKLARKTGGEIISADSRQVYRGMDIGTGKDYDDYIVDGTKINAHLIDIVDAGYEYNVFEFQQDFISAYNTIRERNSLPFLCGGTGLYIEAVLKGYNMINVPVNEKLRDDMAEKSTEQLTEILSSMRNLHNTTDTTNRQRLIRAIEIEESQKNNPNTGLNFPEFSSIILGIKYGREERRKRITERLRSRLENGMIEEAEGLITSGISPEKLEFYGLEYKYLTHYLTGRINYDEMFNQLNTAIHQFAKRQMTWFRKMEREGIKIHWIEGEKSMEEKVEEGMRVIGEEVGSR